METLLEAEGIALIALFAGVGGAAGGIYLGNYAPLWVCILTSAVVGFCAFYVYRHAFEERTIKNERLAKLFSEYNLDLVIPLVTVPACFFFIIATVITSVLWLL